MKRYKLLKDTPAIKAGAIFEEQGNFDDDKELVQVVPDGCLTRPWFAVSDIDNFDEWFEELPRYERWRAKRDEEYWCVDGRGDVRCSTEDGHSVDDYRFDTGSYFKTEEEAKAYKEYLIARQVLLDDAEGGKYFRKGCNWYAHYDNIRHKMDWDYDYSYYPGTIYFATQKAVEESLKKHKEQWDIVRKYETGEL